MPKVRLLIFPFWTSHFIVWIPRFGWTPRLNHTVLKPAYQVRVTILQCIVKIGCHCQQGTGRPISAGDSRISTRSGMKDSNGSGPILCRHYTQNEVTKFTN